MNKIMTKPEGRGHDADSEVMIHQSIPTVTIWRVNIAILIKSLIDWIDSSSQLTSLTGLDCMVLSLNWIPPRVRRDNAVWLFWFLPLLSSVTVLLKVLYIAFSELILRGGER